MILNFRAIIGAGFLMSPRKRYRFSLVSLSLSYTDRHTWISPLACFCLMVCRKYCRIIIIADSKLCSILEQTENFGSLVSPIKSSRMTSFGCRVSIVANPPVEHTVLYQTKLLILLVTHVFSTTVEVSHDHS